VTGGDGSALIQFADGSSLLVQKNSEVSFNTLSLFGETGMVDTQLRLHQGQVETRVKPLRNPDSRFEITTPAAVAAVRGTEFRVSYQSQRQIMFGEVLKGKINIAAEGKEQPVNEGFGVLTERGKAPQPPVKLLDAPQLGELARNIRRLPFSFSWPGLDNAIKYRLQISPAADEGTPVINEAIEQPQFLLNALDDGQYLLKVRGIDKHGLEGLSSEYRFELDTSSLVLQLSSPLTGDELSGHPVILNWIAVKGAKKYQLQLAKSKDFNAPILDVETAETEYSLPETLAEGQYFWRAVALDEQGNRGNYSASRQFSIVENNHGAWLLLLYLLPALVL
ncbi:MAG: FecR domain-containing protein, partial [Gammaproteobacteria bacterium]